MPLGKCCMRTPGEIALAALTGRSGVGRGSPFMSIDGIGSLSHLYEEMKAPPPAENDGLDAHRTAGLYEVCQHQEKER